MKECNHCGDKAKTVMLAMVDDEGHFWLCGRCWRDAGYEKTAEQACTTKDQPQ